MSPGNTPTRGSGSEPVRASCTDPKGAATQNDDEWVGKVLNGDEQAYRHLVEKYKQPLYGYVLAIVGNHHDAQDIIQQGFVAAFRGLPGFDRSRDFRRWLFGITRNLCMDALRKRPRESSVGVALDAFDHLRAGADDAGTGAEDDDALERVRRKFAALAEKDRVVLAMRYLEGRDKTEIGKNLGLSYHAVSQRLHRAMKELRRLLDVGGSGQTSDRFDQEG